MKKEFEINKEIKEKWMYDALLHGKNVANQFAQAEVERVIGMDLNDSLNKYHEAKEAFFVAQEELAKEIEEAAVVKLFENLPMQLNLGDYQIRSHVGWATAFKNERTGETLLEVRLSAEASEKLGDLVEVFDLKAIGFAGYKRKAEDGG